MVRNTSLCTSLEISSTFPGFDKPRVALLSEKLVYVSERAETTALFLRNANGESFSNAIDMTEAEQEGENVWLGGPLGLVFSRVVMAL